MSKVSAEEKLDYLLVVLKHIDDFQPNYGAVAAEKSISNANNAQKKFKKFVEESGKYKLVNGRIVDSDSADVPATPKKVPTTPRKTATSKTPAKKPLAAADEEPERAPKKRRFVEVEKDEELDA